MFESRIEKIVRSVYVIVDNLWCLRYKFYKYFGRNFGKGLINKHWYYFEKECSYIYILKILI
jgi:hypothetical protein